MIPPEVFKAAEPFLLFVKKLPQLRSLLRSILSELCTDASTAQDPHLDQDLQEKAIFLDALFTNHVKKWLEVTQLMAGMFAELERCLQLEDGKMDEPSKERWGEFLWAMQKTEEHSAMFMEILTRFEEVARIVLKAP